MPDNFGPRPVPVVPNASRIRGRIVRQTAGEEGALWEISLDTAEDVEGMPNFAHSYVGQTIQVHLHPTLKTSVKQGDSVEARVAYRGDERGGRFAIVGDDVKKV